uniref:Uncharacterized protein n=1 Tax=Palpitomonas bilix TaxID=652834 RepID=A0A7S3GAE4_9EUKA|mmetsp:Transcript_4057/g.7867  ORF Transcript_4057/g.7867 Transcript_4057/m.7867 type:complete len:435 (+) Transcript_4057:378-1682(+)
MRSVISTRAVMVWSLLCVQCMMSATAIPTTLDDSTLSSQYDPTRSSTSSAENALLPSHEVQISNMGKRVHDRYLVGGEDGFSFSKEAEVLCASDIPLVGNTAAGAFGLGLTSTSKQCGLRQLAAEKLGEKKRGVWAMHVGGKDARLDMYENTTEVWSSLSPLLSPSASSPNARLAVREARVNDVAFLKTKEPMLCVIDPSLRGIKLPKTLAGAFADETLLVANAEGVFQNYITSLGAIQKSESFDAAKSTLHLQLSNGMTVDVPLRGEEGTSVKVEEASAAAPSACVLGQAFLQNAVLLAYEYEKEGGGRGMKVEGVGRARPITSSPPTSSLPLYCREVEEGERKGAEMCSIEFHIGTPFKDVQLMLLPYVNNVVMKCPLKIMTVYKRSPLLSPGAFLIMAIAGYFLYSMFGGGGQGLRIGSLIGGGGGRRLGR